MDAVHATPHRPIDVAALGADLLACSAYKFFGPHVGVLFARRDLLAAWPAYKVRPATEVLPHRWETGTQNHEGYAGTTAAIDYLASLGEGADRRARLVAAMTRIAFGGVLDDYPNLKIICHHSGAMVPFFAGRIISMYRMLEPLIVAERKGRPFSKPIIEYFRSFYADCSTFTTASIECAVDFFGVDHVVYGSDMPFDHEGGSYNVRETMRSLDCCTLAPVDRQKIYEGNARQLIKLPR